MSESPKIKLPKGSLTFTGEYLLEKHGGDMWQDLKKWIHTEHIFGDLDVIDKIIEIEKEYGITYVE